MEATELRVIDGNVVMLDKQFTYISLPVEDKFIGQYHWSRSNGGWRIGFGVSNFLLAEGSGWSIEFGEALYETLTNG